MAFQRTRCNRSRRRGALEVPAQWQTVSVPQDPCPDDFTAPGVIAGALGDVRNCYMKASPASPEVTFAFGGPPDPSVPAGVPEARTVNGVAALVATADLYRDGSESEFLALFPDWDASLRVRVKGDASAALATGNALAARSA